MDNTSITPEDLLKLNTFLDSVDLSNSEDTSVIEKCLLLESAVFKKVINYLFNNKISISDLKKLDEISNNSVAYLLSASEINLNLNSQSSKYEFISNDLSKFISDSIIKFENFAVNRFKSEKDFYITPNLVGLKANNNSSKYFNSYVNIIQILNRYIDDRTVLIEKYHNKVVSNITEISNNIPEIDSKKLSYIERYLNILKYQPIFLATSYLEINRLLYPNAIFGFILRDLYKKEFCSPESIKKVFSEIIRSSTSVNRYSNDGFEIVYNKYNFNYIDFENMFTFSDIVSTRILLGEFYKNNFITSNNLTSDLEKFNLFINLFESIKEYLLFIKDLTDKVILGELE
jgi:hypothetical protein